VSILTKKGDKGFTFLFSQKIRKDDERIEAIGVLDEVSSFLGIGKSLLSQKEKNIITQIQRDLFLLGEKIGGDRKSTKNTMEERISFLEREIREKEKELKLDKKFVLSGDNTVSAIFHFSRALVRRAERRVTTLIRKKILKDKDALVYLNRLSDFLFLIAYEYGKKKKIRYNII